MLIVVLLPTFKSLYFPLAILHLRHPLPHVHHVRLYHSYDLHERRLRMHKTSLAFDSINTGFQ